MHRVLVCSQTGRNSGFGRIARGIAQSLSATYRVHVVGLGPGQENDSWSGHPHHHHDPTRTTALSKLTRRLNPGAVILVGQGQLLAWQVTRLRRDGFSGVIIPYVPMEGMVRDTAPLADLQAATAIVAYTDTGAASLKEALAETNPVQPIPPISVIPHAIDRTVPLLPDRRPALRAALFPAFAQRAEGVWLLNANRNDYRKQPELTIAAFAQIQKEIPEATLVMHCHPERPGMDLLAECNRLGLGDNIIFTHETYPDLLTDEQLTQLYNCCEIGINTALAEGWGLISFEHALCHAAQIIPAHRGQQEIWGAAPLWIPVIETVPADYVFSGQVPQTETLAAAIHHMVTNAQVRQQVAERCAVHAANPRFSWAQVGDSWKKLVGSLLSKHFQNNTLKKVPFPNMN